MDEECVSELSLLISDKKGDSLYPMNFGVSCAFFALRFLSGPQAEDDNWSDIRRRMLQGSAQLLGLLVWRVQRDSVDRGKFEILQKLEIAEREVEELKRRRREDARANEKVVSIYAAQEQSWFNERKKLRQQIGALLNELRFREKKKDKAVAELNEKLKEIELSRQSRDKVWEEEDQKRKDLEEKLHKAENAAEELREGARREAQDHASELRKHKTAFIELVSNQRQLEAEMGRALRQFEAAKQELDSVFEQKEEAVSMVQKLSMEIVRMRKDSEQKDQILSAMLRKSKLDTSERQMLLKEVKSSKVKMKQAELETEKWRAVSESRNERHSLRSMLSKHSSSRSEASMAAREVHFNANESSQIERTRSQRNDFLEYVQHDFRKELEDFSPLSEYYVPKGNDDVADVKRLENYVRLEAEKYANAIEQRHHLELDAFAEQMRLKDEKLEAFRWRLLSMELESKRLQTHMEGLNQDMSQLKQANMKLDALLFDREAELHSLREQFMLQLKPLTGQKSDFNSFARDPTLVQDAAIWSKVKIIKRKPGEKEQQTKTVSVEDLHELEIEKKEEIPFPNQTRETILAVQSPEKELEEEKVVPMEPCHVQQAYEASDEINVIDKVQPAGQCLSKKSSSSCKLDLNALGVSFKIKRLKQQLLMLERFTGKQESGEDRETDDGTKAFLSLMSLLNKQVGRYQSLQGKADELCIRMHENDINVSPGESSIPKTKKETKTLANFLEETFQLQRYIVATGQKMVEIQSKIASGFVGVTQELDDSTNFDIKRFADNVGALFREVQRGLEVRIARIIGDLEGTLACDGIIHFRK